MRFLGPWPHLSVVSAIDIILVAVIIYEFLMLIRGTRAAPMLVGVAVLALAFSFARVGALTTLNWLISTLLPYVVFTLIVVLQSELRPALARLGSRLTFCRTSCSEPEASAAIVM